MEKYFFRPSYKITHAREKLLKEANNDWQKKERKKNSDKKMAKIELRAYLLFFG